MKIETITQKQIVAAIKARKYTPGLEKSAIIAAVELIDLISQAEAVKEGVSTFTPAQHEQWQAMTQATVN